MKHKTFTAAAGVILLAGTGIYLLCRPPLADDRKSTRISRGERKTRHTDSPVQPLSNPAAEQAQAAVEPLLEIRVASPSGTSNAELAPSGSAALSPVGELCLQLMEAVSRNDADGASSASAMLAARGDDALASIKTMLQTGNAGLRRVAFRILLRIGTPGALALATGHLLTTINNEERTGLLREFANVRSMAVTDMLVKLVDESASEDFRTDLLQALAAMEGGEVVDSIDKALMESKVPSQRHDLLAALASLEKPSSLPALELMLESWPDRDVAECAAGAIAGIGSAEAIAVLVRHAEQDTDLADACTRAIASVHSPYAQRSLLGTLTRAVRPELRAAAAQALGRNSGAYIEQALANAEIAERDTTVQAAIRQARGSARPPSGIDQSTPSAGGLIEYSR